MDAWIIWFIGASHGDRICVFSRAFCKFVWVGGRDIHNNARDVVRTLRRMDALDGTRHYANRDGSVHGMGYRRERRRFGATLC